MNIRFRLAASIVLGASLWFFSQQAWSLGLGDATVESYLGEPLEAKIKLITRSSDDLGALTARLASADDFELIGASREAISVPLNFAVIDAGTASYIKVTSKLALKDPVIRLVVELDWENGRMLREYTMFLDPPSFAQSAPAPRQERSQATQSSIAEAAAPRTQPERAALSGVDGEEYGPVQSGETLWRIARDWSGDSGLDVNRIMIAIQRNNPQAFINNNINMLKQGAILRMPQYSEVESLSRAVARDEVIHQVDSYQQRTGGSDLTTPLLADEAAPPPAELEESYDPGQVTDQLELVPPSDSTETSRPGFEEGTGQSGGATEINVLREELSRKEEELFNEQQQNRYLQDRITELESQIAGQDTAAEPAADLSGGPIEGEVSDTELAQMEDRLREERTAASEGEQAGAQQTPPEVPQVVTPPEQESWFSGIALWLIGLLVLGAAAAGWFMSRRQEPEVFISDLGAGENDETVREITDEAEEILQVLETEEPAAEEDTVELKQASAKETAEVIDLEERKEEAAMANDEEAALLDEESADPEIQLDLARAYIAMGDKEAARANLEEVMLNGSEEQQADAKAMMDEL